MIPTKLTVHHTDGNLTLDQINTIHKNRGFPRSSSGYYVGYHKLIFKDGSVVITRKDTEVGAHVKNKNNGNVGVCLVGRFNTEEPTQAQLQTLETQIKNYKLPVYYHRDQRPTECPGDNLVTKLMYTFKVDAINVPGTFIDELKVSVQKYSRDKVKLEVEPLFLPPITAPSGLLLTQDQALQIIAQSGANETPLIFYTTDTPNIYASTSWDISLERPFIIADKRADVFGITFEISHAIQKYYNHNRGNLPAVQIDDIFTPDEAYLYKKFDSVTPYLPLLTPVAAGTQPMSEQEVKLRYLVAFNRLPSDAIDGNWRSWIGKPSIRFDRTILKERAKFLTEQAQQNP